MSATLISPPSAEPVSLAEAKQFLRVEHDDDDDVIAALITGSRIHVEAQTRRALITQTWRIVREAWPDSGVVEIVPAPLRELIAVRLYGADNESDEIDIEEFGVDISSGLLLVPQGVSAPGRAVSGIEIDIEVGYGDEAGDVPEPLRHAIRLLVAHWYENRASRDTTLPGNVVALIAPYRAVSL